MALKISESASRTDADEDGHQFDHDGRHWDHGLFWPAERPMFYKNQIMEKDLEQNTEFRIKYPSGEMGSLPAGEAELL